MKLLHRKGLKDMERLRMTKRFSNPKDIPEKRKWNRALNAMELKMIP